MIWFWLVLPVAIPLFNTIANLFTWPSGKKGLKSSLKISVLIPARNEAKNIESCIEAAAQSQHPIDEIIVYNDGSTDGTGEILNRLKEQHPLLKVIEGTPLPRGWVGKPHACHQLANSARGDLLLFIDADTQLTAEGLSRIVNLLRHKGLDGQKTDIVSAMPHQVQLQFIEQLMM
ncbi:MAG: glycosyltransferase family 2 protein, partial [Myxococcota bacterium]|nr:glycosyltransferase family 2 protein [Myxococcota bacterium]